MPADDVAGLELEFGWHAEQVARTAVRLPAEERIPPACRGSAHPVLLDRLAKAIDARPGLTVLDAGSGLGGPAAWLSRHHGCRVVGADLVEGAVRGARTLFPHLELLVADVAGLPFRSGAFGGAWAIGTLSTVEATRAAIAELYRVLAPGARLAIHDYVATGPLPPGAPAASHFDRLPALLEACTAAGFRFDRRERGPELPNPPDEWRRATDAVEADLARDSGGDGRHDAELRERDAFTRLHEAGLIQPWLLVLERGR